MVVSFFISKFGNWRIRRIGVFLYLCLLKINILKKE